MQDLILRGGLVVDGSGAPGVRADVGLADDRVVKIGDLSGDSARRSIDAVGLIVCPGFIDMHAHSDVELLINPAQEAKVAQGVTLEVLGQDGLSYAPVTSGAVMDELRLQLRGWNGNPPEVGWDWRTVAEYLGRLDRGTAVNVAYLVPHGTLRLTVMGSARRPPDERELDQMMGLLATGLADGALGLSAGLTYTPGMYASDDELVTLCRVVASYGGYYCPHHRNYGSSALQAYSDCIDVARAAGVALHLPHAHLNREVNRGRAPELLDLIDAALVEGIDITFDSYPYTAGATYLHALLPSWVHDDGSDAALVRLGNAQLRERMRVELEETGSDGAHGVPVDWSTVVLSGVEASEDDLHVGRSVAEAAAEAGQAPADFCFDVLIRSELGVSCLVHSGNEDNVRTLMRHRMHTMGSDGILVGARPHPRGWGTFPRYLGRYVRDLRVLELEECIRQMTSLPARRLGLLDRGLLRPGMAADVVCFDPGMVSDQATYGSPRRQPVGIHHVIVNGTPVISDGHHTGALPGRVQRRRDAPTTAGSHRG